MTDDLSSTLADVREFWDASARKSTSDHDRVDTSASSQALRFRMLAEAADLRGRSLLDVGCGMAHLYEHLREIEPDFEYVGLDISPEMIARCREKHPCVRFECAELLAWNPGRRFDYVAAIAIHNVKVPHGRDLLERYLRRQFELADVAAHVSLLTDRYSGYDAHIQPWRAEDILSLALSITPFVSIRHDYLPHDFSITLFRQPLRDREHGR